MLPSGRRHSAPQLTLTLTLALTLTLTLTPTPTLTLTLTLSLTLTRHSAPQLVPAEEPAIAQQRTAAPLPRGGRRASREVSEIECLTERLARGGTGEAGGGGRAPLLSSPPPEEEEEEEDLPRVGRRVWPELEPELEPEAQAQSRPGRAVAGGGGGASPCGARCRGSTPPEAPQGGGLLGLHLTDLDERCEAGAEAKAEPRRGRPPPPVHLSAAVVGQPAIAHQPSAVGGVPASLSSPPVRPSQDSSVRWQAMAARSPDHSPLSYQAARRARSQTSCCRPRSIVKVPPLAGPGSVLAPSQGASGTQGERPGH